MAAGHTAPALRGEMPYTHLHQTRSLGHRCQRACVFWPPGQCNPMGWYRRMLPTWCRKLQNHRPQPYSNSCSTPPHHPFPIPSSVYDMRRNVQQYSGRLPLSPGATLAWLAFSAEGALAALDSAGRMALRTQEFGGAWAPVWDAASVDGGASGCGWWPVALTLASQPQLYAVATLPGQQHPAVRGARRIVRQAVPCA
jgi:hypothetical protein